MSWAAPLFSMLKSIFFLILFLLIKVGDMLIFIASTIKKLAQNVLYFFREHIAKIPVGAISLPQVQHASYSAPRIQTHIQVPNAKKLFKNLSHLFHKYRIKPKKRHSAHKKKRIIEYVTRYKTSFFYKLKYVFLGFFIAFFLIFLPGLFFIFISDLPNPNNLSVAYIPKTTKIYDRHGSLLYEIYANQNRTIVKLSDIPVSLKNATIAIEDRDFYNHPGFDIRGIVRAFLIDIHNSDNLQGGSTITQQLIKSAFLSSEPTLIRKVREVVLAFWAEHIYTKDQILEMYFNYVPYGGTAWGTESAAEIYFGKSVKDLDLAQSTFLAGLPQAPSVYSPYSSNSSNLWKKRQKEVLDAMLRSHMITKDESDKAFVEQLTFQPPQVPLHAPHFVMYVRDYLEKKYGISAVERGGLHVTTTLDLPLQDSAQQIVTSEVAQDAPLSISNGAALITNPQNGDILAMIGSINYFDEARDGNVNLTTALRQPGSTIKLITYALALSNGYTEETPIQDSPLTISLAGETYTPVNYDGKFHGVLPLRLVLGNSLNIPAVRVAQRFGVPAVVKQGQDMGISSWKDANNYGISITLGGADTTMADLATAFGTVANQGKRADLDPLLEVKDSDGTMLYQKNPSPIQVLDAGVAFILSDILADNSNRAIEFGPNTPLVIPGHRVSVKTGTTDQKRDNWTIGFTPNILVATWVGNNDNSPMNPALASGITGAAPMWNKIMSSLLQGKTDAPISIPGDIISKPCNGHIAYFVKGTENSVGCNGFVPFTPTPAHP